MKRKPRFFIGFIAAVITFGSLVAFVGHRHHGRYHHGYSHHHACDGHSKQDNNNNNNNEKADSQENR